MSVIDITFPGNVAQVANVAALRAVPSSYIADGTLYYVTALSIFGWDASSFEDDDGTIVIRPNDITPLQSGRWILNGSEIFASTHLANVGSVSRTNANLDSATQLAGSNYPFQDIVFDSETFGSPSSGLVPICSPPDAFFTPKNTYTYIGAGHVGGVQGSMHYLQIRGAPDAATANRNYTALQTINSATVPLGGTGLAMGTAKGGLFGFSPLAVLYPGATNILNLTGGEVNVQANAGSSVAYKSGLQIVAARDDAVQGSVYDAGLSLSSQFGAVGFKHGILFSGSNGQHAVKSTGTLIGAVDSVSCANGVNLIGSTFSGNAFSSNGFSVDGSGNTYALNFIATSVGSTVQIGSRVAAGAASTQFYTSGAAGSYDAALIGFGGTGAQGSGGILAHCSIFQPSVDNATSLGTSGNRWTQLFAATATISTSDASKKAVLGKLTEFASVLDAVGSVNLLAYKYIDAIAEKGAAARIHAGVLAQDLRDAGSANGVDLLAWGVLCRDPDMESVEEEYQAERPKRTISVIEEDEYTIQDGKAVKRRVTREVEHDETELLSVVDEDGAPVMIPARAADQSATPLMHSVPVMETYTATRTIQRRKTDDGGNDAWVWGIRYTEFMVLRQAWAEREMGIGE